MKKNLKTPIKSEDVEQLTVGDLVFLDGYLVTCRDMAHRRLIDMDMELPVDLQGMAILHAGPIVTKDGDGWKIVSIGPMTGMRMEVHEKEFIEKTGTKMIVGKGGMGPETVEGCATYKAVHAVFLGGCAVLAASRVREIERVEWLDLAIPKPYGSHGSKISVH